MARPFKVPFACTLLVLTLCSGCRGATHQVASPQAPAETTAATLSVRIDRVLVAEGDEVSLVSRGGCVALVRTMDRAGGGSDELRLRCPKPERMAAWFDATDRELHRIALAPVAKRSAKEEDDDAPTPPTAKVLTAKGDTLQVVKAADIKKLSSVVKALSAELAAAEEVAPGPASPGGWQMLRVLGPAHVVFAGAPAHGVLEARVSTNGQYLCEFFANVGDGPLHATKSGWLSPTAAAHAIDEVLVPFAAAAAGGEEQQPKGGYAAATSAGSERHGSAATTAAVFERFAQVQDALGDACLPELEAPNISTVKF
jgi:hypothetical protein